MLTSAACQSPSAESQDTPGPFLSTLLPPTGPAVVVLPTASLTVLLFVWALLVSVPAATSVERLKPSSACGATPDPPSVAVQAMLTSAACQSPSAESQDTPGPFLSTLLPPTGPAVAVLPTASLTVLLFV